MYRQDKFCKECHLTKKWDKDKTVTKLEICGAGVMWLGHSIFMGTPRGPPSSHPSCHTWEGKRKICRKENFVANNLYKIQNTKVGKCSICLFSVRFQIKALPQFSRKCCKNGSLLDFLQLSLPIDSPPHTALRDRMSWVQIVIWCVWDPDCRRWEDCAIRSLD